MTFKEVSEELKSVITGKTVDAMIPPFIYIIANTLWGLSVAVVLAVIASLALVAHRFQAKKTWTYALSGLIGIIIAATFAFIANNAANYYLPKFLSSVGLILLTLVSLILRKPLAAWLSHLSRGWELEWFWRKDVKPAYTEVTLFWLILMCMRAMLQFLMLLRGDITTLFIVNTLLGLPVTLSVLVLSYIYGIWRLKKLGGPGIDEHRMNQPKPWKGQTRGF